MKKNRKIILIIMILIFTFILGAGIYIKVDKNVSLKSIYNTINLVKNDKNEINSANKLEILSPYGDTEAYHPKVLNFEQEWNGYKYWMSYTPYPQGDDSKENPCIAVSNDLINWTYLGEKNIPLDEPEKTMKYKKYNSDSHIVYNNKLDRLECYWRYVDDISDEAIIYRKTTTNGIDWTEKEISYLGKPRKENDCISPAIIYDNGTYKMWYEGKGNNLYYMESSDGIEWTKSKKLYLEYEEDVRLWHLDVIQTQKSYEMLLVAYENWNMRNDMNLYYTKSTDGIKWEKVKKILEPTRGSKKWDNKGIYRTSFIYEDGVYYVYYSGTDTEYHHGIGFLYGNDIFNLNKVNVDYKNKKQVNKLINKIRKEVN